MFLRIPSCCTGFDHVTNQFHLSLNFYFVLLFFYFNAHKNYSNYYQVSNIHNVWYFFERLVCLPKNSTCLVLWETHLSYHCLANLYFQGKSYSKLKFSNMRTQYLYNHKANWVIFRSLLCMKPLIYFVCISAFKILVIFQCWALETL